MEKRDLLGLDLKEMKAFAAELGEAPFRGRQLFKWIYRGAEDFDDMTDLPCGLRQKLAEKACIGKADIAAVQHDESDDTRKLLLRFKDGNAVESVFMKYRYGNSLCVSSQVGCKMGCRFCASALGGFVRDLTAGEIMEQIFAAEKAAGENINHIVIMGMGEPFDNYINVSRFLRLLHDPDGKNMGYRSITVSTSGIVPGIYRFSEDFPQVNLAISLHSLDDTVRSGIMPVNDVYPVDEVLKAARYHTEKTGRRVTFEYSLIKGKNDSTEDIDLIIKKLKGMLCHINLIPLNKVDETGFAGSSRSHAVKIAEKLVKEGIPATVRREIGTAIDGACGQLRRKTL